MNSKWTNSFEWENIAFDRKPSKVYLDFIDNSKNMASRKASEALFITDQNDNEELKIDGGASSLDCYSD